MLLSGGLYCALYALQCSLVQYSVYYVLCTFMCCSVQFSSSLSLQVHQAGVRGDARRGGQEGPRLPPTGTARGPQGPPLSLPLFPLPPLPLP